jgi:hypothetical protein
VQRLWTKSEQGMISSAENFDCSETELPAVPAVRTVQTRHGWETLSQRRKTARICALFKAYSGEWAWKFIGDRLQRPNYLSKIEHDWKIRNRRQRTDIGKYSFVNRTIRLWNRLPAEILGTLPCKPRAFRKKVRKVINVVNYLKSAVNWIEVKWNVVHWRGLHRGVPWRVFMFGEVKWSWRAVKWSEVYTCGLTALETRYSSICNFRFKLYCGSFILFYKCVYEWVL